jgi:hypothetical protein
VDITSDPGHKLDALDKRKYLRVDPPHSISEGDSKSNLPIINVSHAGVCLWFSDSPPNEQDLALLFMYADHSRVLRSRIVWSRFYQTSPDHENPHVAEGWFVGLEFAEEAVAGLATDVPYEIFHSGHLVVTLHTQRDATQVVDRWQNPGGGGTPPLQ